MLGDFISRCLLMLFGYAYPAFECYKTVMKKSTQIEELRFWCQYWIIAALITIFERIGDIFISWLPMYSEIKLALFIYLWYPKTQGTGYIFNVLLRPFIIEHELDIEQKLQQWRAKAWDLTIFYWKNCTELGQSSFFQFFQYLTSPSSSNSRRPVPEILKGKKKEEREQPAPQSKDWFPFLRKSGSQTKEERPNTYWSPSAPPLDSAGAYPAVSEPHGRRSETEYDFVDEDNIHRRGDEFGRAFNDGTDQRNDINLVRRR